MPGLSKRKESVFGAFVLSLIIGAVITAPILTSFASDGLVNKIPAKVLQAYADAEPAAIRKSLSKCQSSEGDVYKVSWSTGYEIGSLFLSADGQSLGTNRQSDVGLGLDEYDEGKLSNCVILIGF